MASYIARRLLLMVPTIIGITLLVFLLLALSPGGIGAGLRVSGGQMEASKAALLEAYLEDRYGLKDPVVVQYGRWLSRMSPIKFGRRDQAKDGGELVRAPREVKVPLLSGTAWNPWRMEDASAQIAAAKAADLAPLATTLSPALRSAWNEVSRGYAKARAEYMVSRRAYERSLAHYAVAVRANDLVESNGEVNVSGFASLKPDKTRAEFQEVESAGATMDAAWIACEQSRVQADGIFQRKPFVEVGVPILPSIVHIASPDLGVAFSRGRPVADLILDALPVTILINLIAIPIIYLIAVPTGILAAARRGQWFDSISGAIFVAMWSIPTVWAGVLMIGYLADNQYLGWFPVAGLHAKTADQMTFLPSWSSGQFAMGYVLDELWHIALPVACLVYGGFAVLAKQTRAAMLDNANMDFVRTAKAKGVPTRDVLIYHVFRNSLLPLITMFVSIFPAMLAGSLIVEKIFSIPGMGSLMLDAINMRDRELILADTFMIGMVNLLALLVADIMYAFADPRISFD
ncbi:MAG: ABC transporter permease [Planctomycetota bacterium]|nr:ABC transporter permease [Planctomycetota bacterium]